MWNLVPSQLTLTLRKSGKCYSNLMKISMYFERCPLAMVSNEINAHSQICLSRMKCPWQDACEAFELWGLPSEEWERQYLFLPGWPSGLTFHCRAKKPEDLKGLAVSPNKEAEKAHLETGTLFCQKTSVCKTTNTGNTGTSNTSRVSCFLAMGTGKSIRKYRMANSLCAQGKTSPRILIPLEKR